MRATSSPQAPAAFTMTGARKMSPEEVCACQALSCRQMRPARLRSASTPPAARAWRRKPWCMAATSMSKQSSSIAAIAA